MLKLSDVKWEQKLEQKVSKFKSMFYLYTIQLLFLNMM